MGYTALPRWDLRNKRVALDWVQDTEIAPVDVRVVRSRKHGLIRLTFISHLRVIHSQDGRNIDSTSGNRFVPENEYEEFGVEDPRIVRIGDTYYITYVAVSCHGVATALASALPSEFARWSSRPGAARRVPEPQPAFSSPA